IGYFRIEAPDAVDEGKFIGVDDLTLDNPAAAPTPGFGLSADSPDISLLQGGTASDTITVNRSNFTGGLTFASVGLPSGVPASFLPNPSSGTKVEMRLAASNTAAPTGSAGAAFTVRASAATATPSPRQLSFHVFVQQTYTVTLGVSDVDLAGCTSAIPVTVTRDLAFPGPVQLSATGVPAGVTATFDPTTLDFH